jgi:hypothetical protein
MQKFTLSKPQFLALIALLLVFIIDFIIPLGVSVGILYLVCFFIVMRESKETIIVFAVITSALVIFDLAIIYRVDIGWKEYADVVISILSIWLTASMAIKFSQLYKKNHKENEDYTKTLEDVLFIVSHKIRKPIASWLGLIKVLDMTNPTKEEVHLVYSNIESSAKELDAFTRELTMLISNIKFRRDRESGISE